MAGFTIDLTEVEENNSEGVTPGTYEAVIKSVSEDNKFGFNQLDFDFVIRRDITEQRFGGAHVHLNISPKKDTGKYPIDWLMRIAKSAGFENKKTYATVEDFYADFAGRPVLVRVIKNEFTRKDGTKGSNSIVNSVMSTKFPTIDLAVNGITTATGFGNGATEVNIADDDLPF